MKYDNSGSLFHNEDRTEENNYPHYSGSITVDGQEYWLSAWVKKGKEGKKNWMSLAVKAKEASNVAQDDDDMPF